MSMNTVQNDRPPTTLARGLSVQMSVIGAMLMRELHTRYGRDNVGYLWMVGEPLLLGSVIALIHSFQNTRDSSFNAVTLATVGYALFIMFRGIINRSDGALEANLPLLYHRMVTVMDIVMARALLEAAGTFLSFIVLYFMLMQLGFATFPVRPLMLMIGTFYLFWLSLSVSMIIVGGTYEHKLLERLVHPFSYFMIPLSGAFFRVAWMPAAYRGYILINPFPHIFEIIRYGVFEDATLEYVNWLYLTGFCMVLTLFGLLAVRGVRKRIHLN